MKEYLTVTQLNQYIKSVVESDFSLLRVTLIGEVSTLTKHFSGHFYFTLKDENSQIKCMMFSSYASKIDFDLKNGDQVIVTGSVGVYEKGGTYQLYCKTINQFGEGQYLIQLEKLKRKLKEEGLFDKEKKKLPLLPKRIGLITAKTGAAIHDFFSTMNNRLKVETYIFPSLVQGDDAPKSIIDAINVASEFDLDILVITRGGGSKEDLRCFNDESLVRRASEIKIPLVTAVGHQIDTTLIDYVSDLVCITPTDAANKIIPLKVDLVNRINNYNKILYNDVNKKIRTYALHLMLLGKNLEAFSPKNKLKTYNKNLMLYDEKITKCIKKVINNKIIELNDVNNSITRTYKRYIEKKYLYLKLLDEKLEYLNPRSLLKNGYGIINNEKGKIISSINQVKKDEIIVVNLNGGKLKAKVIDIEEEN